MNFDIKKLNLGSGKFPKKGYINLDIDKNSSANIIHDLEVYPWPLPSNHFEIIEMDHKMITTEGASWDFILSLTKCFQSIKVG